MDQHRRFGADSGPIRGRFGADSGLKNVIAKAGLDPDRLGPATEMYRQLLVEHIYSKIDPLKL